VQDTANAFTDRLALEAGLATFFRFYHDERIHAALDYLTPGMVYAAA